MLLERGFHYFKVKEEKMHRYLSICLNILFFSAQNHCGRMTHGRLECILVFDLYNSQKWTWCHEWREVGSGRSWGGESSKRSWRRCRRHAQTGSHRRRCRRLAPIAAVAIGFAISTIINCVGCTCGHELHCGGGYCHPFAHLHYCRRCGASNGIRDRKLMSITITVGIKVAFILL